MVQLNEDQQRKLATELVAAIQKVAPGWTSSNASDPGITLLEVFEWLTEVLIYRNAQVSDRTRSVLKTLLSSLNAPAPNCAADGLIRPRYYNGQLLSAADFQAEQDYMIGMRRLHNRFVLGAGVVTGLGVTLDPKSAATGAPVITVSAGCAIDSNGQELIVCEPLRCTLSSQLSTGFVVLRFVERAVAPVPGGPGVQEPSRIQEGVALDLQKDPPVEGVAIARLERGGGRWRIDSRFRPDKVKQRRTRP